MIDIAGVFFEGPFTSTDQIRDESGIYVVASPPATSGIRVWLDVGESANLKTRLDSHDRQDCWRRNSPSGWVFFISYCNEAERMRVEAVARKFLRPVCGDR